jgi:hypothetical protein
MNVMKAAIEQVKNSEFVPNFAIYNVNGKIKVFKRKQTPQRTYTRNGVIFKTIDGKRIAYRRQVNNKMIFLLDVPEEIIISERNVFINRTLEVLNICDEIEYVVKEIKTGYEGDQYIKNEITVRIIYERVKPN